MKFTTGDTVVTFEKLWFLQRAHAGRYLDAGDTSKISMMKKSITTALKSAEPSISFDPLMISCDLSSHIDKLLQADGRSYTNGSAFLARNRYFFTSPTKEELQATRPNLRFRQVPLGIPFYPDLVEVTSSFTYLSFIPAEQWKAETIKTCINSIIATKTDEMAMNIAVPETDFEGKKTQLGRAWSKVIHQYIRWAAAAGMPGPDGAESLEILGRKQTLDRLEMAAEVFLASDNKVVEVIDDKAF
jgi:glutamyl-tRNA synthetase